MLSIADIIKIQAIRLKQAPAEATFPCQLQDLCSAAADAINLLKKRGKVFPSVCTRSRQTIELELLFA